MPQVSFTALEFSEKVFDISYLFSYSGPSSGSQRFEHLISLVLIANNL